MNNILKKIKRDVMLLINSPREYLYSFTYFYTKKIKIDKYDVKTTELGNMFVKKINKLLPNLKVNFFGSAALKIDGQKDVDLFVECAPSKFDECLPSMISIFGPKFKRRPFFIEWNIYYKGVFIECLLIDPKSSMFKMQKRTFVTLKNNKSYLDEYVRIKRNSNNSSYGEYQRTRMEFFNRILGINKKI